MKKRFLARHVDVERFVFLSMIDILRFQTAKEKGMALRKECPIAGSNPALVAKIRILIEKQKETKRKLKGL